MATTYFDQRYETMAAGREGVWPFAYERQVAFLESLIKPGMTVLDVGCGPNLPYRADHAYVIGLDPSEASLAVNTDVDERIVGTATAIPLPDASVDLAVAMYAIHHMTTQTIEGSQIRAEHALREMLRVVRPGGEVLVFEMTPHPFVWWAEWQFWNFSKAVLGDRLDPVFWPAHVFDGALPGRHPTVQTFACSPFATFPPAFALPWLRIPRFLFPFTATLYRWRV